VLGIGQGAVHIKNQNLEHRHLLQKNHTTFAAMESL